MTTPPANSESATTTEVTDSPSVPVNEGTQLQQELDDTLRELATYRDRVRERAIRGHRNNDWTLERLNESLRNLGLEPFVPTYVHQANAHLAFTIRIDDDDYDRASNALRFIQSAENRETLQKALSTLLQQHSEAATISIVSIDASCSHPNRVEVD